VLCVLLFFLAFVRGWVVQTDYEDQACKQVLETSVFAPGCVSIDGVSFYITCSGDNVIYQPCDDAACTNCPYTGLTNILAGTCTEGTAFTCPTSFPSFPSSSLVTETFDNPSCSGEPFQWTASPLVPDCATTPCISANIPGFSFAEKEVCGSAVSNPSGNGPAQANCTIVPDSCSFYLNCVEQTVPCAATDYAIAYGYNYCSKYLSRLSELSPQGQQWVEGVLLCLQKALLPVVTASPRPSCATIRSKAFASHPVCYTNNYAIVNGSGSICYLPPSDWPVIISIVYTGLLSAQGAFQTVITGSSCLFSYAVGGVWKLGQITGETYSSLQSKLAALAETDSANIAILDASDPSYTWEGDRKRSPHAGAVNVTFSITGSNSSAVQQSSTTFNNQFATQSYWSGATLQQCTTANAAECGSSNITIYGAEPPSSQTNSASGTLFSVLLAFVFVLMTATI